MTALWGILALSGVLTFGFCSIYNMGYDKGQGDLKDRVETAVDAHETAAEAVYQDELEDGAGTVEGIEAADDEGEILEGVLDLYDR